MAITDLTGTTWVFNNILALNNLDTGEVEQTYTFNINFTCQILLSNSSITILAFNEGDDSLFILQYSGNTVYQFDGAGAGWYGEELKTIQITGGTDATNSALISWLTENATQVVPSSLSLTATYNNNTIINTTSDGTFTLPTANKYMSTDIVLTASGISSLVATYNGNNIVNTSSDGTFTLKTAGKYMATNIGVSVSGGSPPPETPTNAVIFYSLNPFTLQTNDADAHWDGTLYYSVNNSTWATWNGSDTLDAEKSNGYYKLYLRGSGNTKITGYRTTSIDYRWIFTGTGITCKGNLNNLLNYTGTPTLANYAFSALFRGCDNIDFDITLPATTLADQCYSYMFYGCTSLTSAPTLPATTMKPSCYSYMFYGCTSLTSAPALPATTLATYCYSYMFGSCTSLTSAPALPVRTLSNACYHYMFYNCSSLITPPALPATTLENYCYQYMFNHCTSLTSVPALPATTLKAYCYEGMFGSCSNIKLSTTKTGAYQTAYRIPTSGTGTTKTSSLSYMFQATGGTFKGTPTINTTYYTSNTVVS